MADESMPGEGMVVTALEGDRGIWLVTGPYWEAGGDDEAMAAFSSMIDGEAEALAHARQLVGNLPGCKLVIERRGG